MKVRNKSSKHSTRSQAFTLVEILVVIGIVLLLSGILFPVIGHVKAAGRRTTCASNLKQIYLGMSQYAQDYRFFPSEDSIQAGANKTCSCWALKLFPYIKSNDVFECPSSPLGLFRSDCPVAPTDTPTQRIAWGGSYDINIPNASEFIDPNDGSTTEHIPERHILSFVSYVRPSSTIMVLDGDGLFVSPGYQQPAPTNTTTLASYGVDAHHEGGLNAAFADGHVKYQSMDSLLKLSLWKLAGPE